MGILAHLQSAGILLLFHQFRFVPDDKRYALLSPTEKGQKLICECQAIFDEWNKEWLAQFNAKELLQILESV